MKMSSARNSTHELRINIIIKNVLVPVSKPKKSYMKEDCFTPIAKKSHFVIFIISVAHWHLLAQTCIM